MLSNTDSEHLANLQPRLDLVCDRVRGVVKHLATGLWLWGDGGLGKSFTVLEELRTSRSSYVFHNSRLTGRGLYDMLAKFPSSLHVIEDCETLLDDRRSHGVLRSAFWSQSRICPPQRFITWTAFKTNLDCVFTGGLIMIANKGPEDIPEINAMKTRISVLRFAATNEELAALMRSVAEAGYSYGDHFLSPETCHEIAEFIIAQFKEMNRNLDMRLLINGFNDYIQWQGGDAKTDWMDLITTRMRETTMVPLRRTLRTAAESQTAVEISKMAISYAEKITQWETRTGHKGERSYYRALERAEK